MRALKVTALVVAIAATAIICGGWAIGRQAPVSPGEMYIGPETAKTLDFLEAKFGLSRSAAVDMLHRTAARPGHGPVVDRLDLPKDALLDFIDVNGASKTGSPTVRYLGSARAFAADSKQGRDFYAMYRDAALRNHWSSALAAMDNLRAHGTVLAPAWVGADGLIKLTSAAVGASTKPAAGRVGTAAAGRVGTAGTVKTASATTYRVAVICAEFPEWLDIPPSGKPDSTDYTAGVHYYPIPGPPFNPMPYRNVQGYTPGTDDYYLDSTGGTIPQNGWAPVGTQSQWNYQDGFGTKANANGVGTFDDHPARLADPRDGATSTKLQNYWYRRLFDMNYTGTDSANDIGGYIGSLASYYWDESFGNVSLTGDTTDIYGWISSRHVLDRRESASGPPFYMIQPGTPIIRPTSTIESSDGTSGANPGILRASLTNNKLTILFNSDQGSPPYITSFQAYQNATDGSHASGVVTVYINGTVPGTYAGVGSTANLDPYDNRRVTYVRGTWAYISTVAPPASPPATINFAIVAGAQWSFSANGDTWNSSHFGYQPQDDGCAKLPSTLFVNADTLNGGTASQSGSRLKSFDYYCHDYYNNQSRGPYQLNHIFHTSGNAGAVYDDIGGDIELSTFGNETERSPRPYPFDCGLPSTAGGSDLMQLGYFHFLRNNNAAPTDGGGDHSSGGMETDAYQAMADQGITMNGTYAKTIFIFAGGSVGENSGATTGSNESATWGTIISHAGGSQVTVGEDCGLGTMAHEMGHTFGFPDLYDANFYTNKLGAVPPYPQYFECVGMNPYSVMAMGGTRIDPKLLASVGWATPTVATTDITSANLPQMENSARTPVIYKLPADPYYMIDNTPQASWAEYYLLEFRGQGFRGNPAAGWWGDPAPRGFYIYRVSQYGQTVQNPDYSFHPLGYVPEQASGLYHLENDLMDASLLPFYPGTTVEPPFLTAGDPFGVDSTSVPGASSNHDFSQWPFKLADFYNSFATSTTFPTLTFAPTSNSKGLPDGHNHPTPGTDTDSFTRVLNIQLNGAGTTSQFATADIYVTPREIVATGKDLWPTTANKLLTPWYVDSTVTPAVWQGQSNVPVMQLKLDNQANTGAGDYVHMSKGDVTIRALRVLQSGSSTSDSDVSMVKLWDIKDTTRAFNPSDPTQCTLLDTTTLSGKVASFGTPDPSVHSDMNYNVPLGIAKYILVTYDISPAATIRPTVTLAGDLPDPRYVWPQPPGAVQQKIRNAAQYSFGTTRFPIQTTNTAALLKATDTLFIASTSVAPSTVKPSDTGVPVLAQTLTAQKNQVSVHQLHYVCLPSVTTPAPNAQQDVSKAHLYYGTVTNGALDAGAVNIADAVFSATNDLVFDNLDTVSITVGTKTFNPLVVNAGTPVPLVITFDMSGNPKSVGDYLELQLDNPTVAIPGETPPAYSVTLVDEDGPGNTIYQDPANPNHYADVAHIPGGNTTGWTLVAGMDQVNATGAPWKSSDFRVNPPTLPMLSQTAGKPLFTPTSGDQHSTFAFRITYTSSNNVKPTFMNLVYRVPGATTDTTVAMSEVNANDTNYVDGKDYIVQVTGLTITGVYKFYFTASDGMTTVYFFAALQVGGTQATPGTYYTAPRDLGDYINGPTLYTPSTTQFFNFGNTADTVINPANPYPAYPGGSTYVTNRSYEEGRFTDPTKPLAQRIYIRVNDPDANLDPGLIDHVTVTLTGSGTGADTEVVTLNEVDATQPLDPTTHLHPTATNTGVFEGSILTIGKAGATKDGTFNAIGGTAGQTITATYADAADTPPGFIDTSKDTAMVVDTRAPDPIPAAMLIPTIATDGTSITLDWTGYEATQLDVAGYKVYVSTAPFTDVSSMTPTATLAAGVHSYAVVTTTEQIYHLAVCPFDEVPNMWRTTAALPDGTPGVTVLTENLNVPPYQAPPFIVTGSQSPAPGATGILIGATTIQCQVQDVGSGINTGDPTAITVSVSANDGSGARTVTGTTTLTPGATAQAPVSVVFVATNPWHWNDVVTVDLKAHDKAGNALDTNLPTPSWVFNVQTDTQPPTLGATDPTNGAVNVAPDKVVTFHLLDDGSGVNLSTIQLQVQINSGGWTAIPLANIGTQDVSAKLDQTDILCTYPKSGSGGWAFGAHVQFRVMASDNIGGPAHTSGWLPNDNGWSFDIFAAGTGITIPDSSLVPARGATNVPLNQPTINFDVLDSNSDINQASITLTIDGNAATPLTISGTTRVKHVSYTLPAGTLKVNEQHTCVAGASDVATPIANTASNTWSWSTIRQLPTFTLTTPTNGATGVTVSSPVVVHIVGVNSNIDPATIVLTVKNGAVAVPGTIALSSAVPAPTIDATFTATPQLPGSATLAVHAEASDVALPVPNHGTADFSFTTGVPPTYTIVGRITNSVGGTAVSAVQVNLTGGATASTLTDGNGFYQFKNLLANNYTVTPSSTAWSFVPDHRDITLTSNINNADFTATQIAYALRGHITLGGNPLPGVNVSVGARSTTTLADGSYAITGLVPAAYTVTPTLAGYAFTPTSLPATITTGDVTGLDFTALALTFSISGVISDNNGNRLSGVSVTAGTGSATTADTGRYTIGAVPTGTVSVQVSKAGYLFFWLDSSAVYHLAPEVVSVPPDQTDINFTGFPVTSQSFSAGFHMIGVPIFPRDPTPTVVFGTDLLARWDPTTGVYATARAIPPNEVLTTSVAPGIGFWVFYTSPVTLNVAGTPVSTATPFPLATFDGWNMLANPFLTQLPFANIATVSGSIRPFAYTYDPVSGSYLLIAASPGIGIARSYILPWEAMWILSSGSSSLTATAATGTAAASADDVKALQLDLGQSGWYLPVTARAGDRRDECCAVGVRASGAALSLEKPPAMSNSVDVSVLSASGAHLSRSIATAGKTKYQWDLQVTTDLADTDVSVALPDLSKVPSSMRVMLTDVDANKTVYMRTTAQYTFHTATSGTTLRHLQITVESGSGAGLVLSAASARAAGSRVTVSYTASAPCSVTATVLNIAGRSVRVLASGATAAAGVNTLSWDGRSTSGSLVPAGIYLVQLDAVADDGQRVRSVTQLNLSGRR